MMDKRGFTLTELMVTVAIIAIMAGIAAPNMGPWLAKQRLNSATRQMAAHFNMARSQAVKANEVARFSFNTGGRWYTVIGSSSGVIVPKTTLSNDLTLAISFPSSVTTTGFDTRGLAWNSRNGTVTLTNNKMSSNNKRYITLSLGGGVSITP